MPAAISHIKPVQGTLLSGCYLFQLVCLHNCVVSHRCQYRLFLSAGLVVVRVWVCVFVLCVCVFVLCVCTVPVCTVPVCTVPVCNVPVCTVPVPALLGNC